MKKTFLSYLVKPTLFLALVTSVINVQPISAQRGPSVVSRGITVKLVDEQGNEIENSELEASKTIIKTSTNPFTNEGNKNVIDVTIHNQDTNAVYTNYFEINTNDVEFNQNDKALYKAIGVKDIVYKDNKYVANDKNQITFDATYNDEYGVYAYITVVPVGEENKDKQEPSKPDASKPGTSNAKANTTYEPETDEDPVYEEPVKPVEVITTEVTPTTTDKEVKTTEAKKEEKPVKTDKPVRKEPVYREDSKALRDYSSTFSIRESRVVRFHYDESLDVDKVVFVTAGDKLDANQIPQPTKQGYEFLGWYYKESDAYKFAPRAVKEDLLPFDFNKSIYVDLDLYAQWKKVEVVNVPQVINKKPVPNTADC